MPIAPDARTFYVAWLGSEQEAFDAAAHRRKDLGLKSVSFKEEEGVDAHVCSIVTNLMPTAQLAGKRWAMLSFAHPDGTLHPICKMKRRPIPSTETQGELALEFDVLPTDWMQRRDDVLSTMKVLPFFDPLLVALNRRNDPVEILDGYRRIGHFNRVTHEFTTPELLGVGAPVKVLRKADLVGWKDGGGVRVRAVKTPLAGVQCYGSLAFEQADDGYLDLTPALKQGFPNGSVGDRGIDGPSPSKQVPSGVIATCTPDALEGSLPQKGAGVGGASGYTVLQSTLTRIPVPNGASAITGAVRGQKARYDFTKETDLKLPINLGHEIAYYDGSLVLSYSLRQRREERLGFYIANANVAYADGAVETVTVQVQNPTIDENARPYLPGENVAAGDERRNGIYVWAALRPHVTHGAFAEDLYAADGREQWELLGTNGSPAGTANLVTYFGTPRGAQTAAALAYKGHKKLSLSQRRIEVKFAVPLEDWLDITTGWVAQVEVDDPLVPSGVARGKVTSYEMAKSNSTDWPKLLVTITCCDGGGVAGPDQAHGINPSGESWDGITLSSPIGVPVPAAPVPNGIVVVENHPQAQVTYVQGNDYTGLPGRDDRSLNDPKKLLGDVKTKWAIYCEQISGQPTLSVDIALAASAWSGDAQIVYAVV